MEMRAGLLLLKKKKINLSQSFPFIYETEDGTEHIEVDTLVSFMHIVNRKSPICR